MIDLLRATTTICSALAAGAKDVVPFREIAETLAAAEDLSMEFLVGRSLANNLRNLGLFDAAKEVFAGVDAAEQAIKLANERKRPRIPSTIFAIFKTLPVLNLTITSVRPKPAVKPYLR